jgi:glutamate-1-semialdehyde 2,1-aminomutase
LLVAAGSGALTHGKPDSAGVPQAFADLTVALPFNDEDAVERTFAACGDEIAAVIVEPVPANAGLILPRGGYLAFLRDVTRRHGALLIFDEVMTGWRVHPRGAQVLYDVTPDLTCLGKVVGGGLPAAAYGGSRELMEQIAPAGPVYQAGTLSGNPLAMAAALATLEVLEDPSIWRHAERWADAAARTLESAAAREGVEVTVQRVGTMLTPFFTSSPVTDFAGARRTDRGAYNRFFHAMLEHGVYLPPSAFEAAFTSAVHGEEEMAVFERAVRAGFRAARAAP